MHVFGSMTYSKGFDIYINISIYSIRFDIRLDYKSITHSTEPPPLSTNWNQLLRGMSLAESHSKICLPRGMRWNDVDKLVEMYASLHAKFSSITAPLRTQDLMATANHRRYPPCYPQCCLLNLKHSHLCQTSTPSSVPIHTPSDLASGAPSDSPRFFQLAP